MWTSILPTSISLPNPQRNHLSSISISSGVTKFGIFPPPMPDPRPNLAIKMGGGPRTFPGGVSKWQWKRMQTKKAKQLLKARLCRERQLYEMRKRAELKAAVAELERPWEAVERAPALFSVRADEQLKVLADRFQRPGGFDMWSERDGPQVFRTSDGLPSARFFPKDAIHSLKPYGVFSEDLESGASPNISDDEDEEPRFETIVQSGRGGRNRRSRETSSSRVSNGNGYSDRMDVRHGHTYSKSSESSISSPRERIYASPGRRNSVDNSVSNSNNEFRRSFHNGTRRNSEKQQPQQRLGDSNGLNSDFKRSQTKQT